MQEKHLNHGFTHPTHLNFLDSVEAIVLKNLSDETFNMTDLAQGLLMSSSQIYRKIKKQTGHSPSVFIRNIRLQQAKILIDKSDLSLSEISYKVGFNSLPYFSRCFSKHYGVSPSAFRGNKHLEIV